MTCLLLGSFTCSSANMLLWWEQFHWKVDGTLPEEVGLGRRLCGRIPLAVMLGSDMEWMMVDSEEFWLSVEEGTSRSRVWALAEEAKQGAGWRGGRGSESSGEPGWHMYRPIERFPESGRGKVPIPLSSVLIWQFDSNIEKKREKLERADRK